MELYDKDTNASSHAKKFWVIAWHRDTTHFQQMQVQNVMSEVEPSCDLGTIIRYATCGRIFSLGTCEFISQCLRGFLSLLKTGSSSYPNIVHL